MGRNKKHPARIVEQLTGHNTRRWSSCRKKEKAHRHLPGPGPLAAAALCSSPKTKSSPFLPPISLPHPIFLSAHLP
ncbi:unnamed protein product, partial [Ectocarpus sp. 13 AM-2016]